MSETRVAAHHEAGHVVVAFATRLGIEYAGLEDNDDGGGHVAHSRSVAWIERQVALHRTAHVAGGRIVTRPMRLTAHQRDQIRRFTMVCWGA